MGCCRCCTLNRKSSKTWSLELEMLKSLIPRPKNVEQLDPMSCRVSELDHKALKSSRTWSSISRCCAVTQTFTTNWGAFPKSRHSKWLTLQARKPCSSTCPSALICNNTAVTAFHWPGWSHVPTIHTVVSKENLPTATSDNSGLWLDEILCPPDKYVSKEKYRVR